MTSAPSNLEDYGNQKNEYQILKTGDTLDTLHFQLSTLLSQKVRNPTAHSMRRAILSAPQLPNNEVKSRASHILKAKVYEESARKLRETSKDESDEIEQQKAQDFKVWQDELIIGAPPPQQYPSGIFSIVIH